MLEEWPPKDRTIRSWKHGELECSVVKGGWALCGYVKVPRGHPDAKAKSYDDVAGVKVHGGLTWMEKCPGGGRWFGFDTGHAGDWIGIEGYEMPGRIWTVEDVEKETNELAAQFEKRGVVHKVKKGIRSMKGNT